MSRRSMLMCAASVLPLAMVASVESDDGWYGDVDEVYYF